ncbi:hypothetical protein IMZ48_20305 [Candidatus Bathyarchaeota archaeon]|nr:hypothetical protein [Candidatus Bathyarchaeota archaeon]
MILLFQRLVCGHLRGWNTREALLKGFHHGLQTILKVTAEGDESGEDDKLSDEMASFRHGAEGMARLLADPKYVEAPHLSVCVGVHVASAMIQDDWDNEYHAKGLEKGAEAVRALLARDGQDFRAHLDGFCQGVKGTMGLITKAGLAR